MLKVGGLVCRLYSCSYGGYPIAALMASWSNPMLPVGIKLLVAHTAATAADGGAMILVFES